MKRKLKLLRTTWILFGTLNHYWGCEKLTILDYLYKKRIGFNSAYSIAKMFHGKVK
jgi:hypothetical protein